MKYLAKIYASIANGMLTTSVIIGVFLAGEEWGFQAIVTGSLSAIILISCNFLYRERKHSVEPGLHLFAAILHVVIWAMYLNFSSFRFGGSPGDILHSSSYSLIHFINLYFCIGTAISIPITFLKKGKIETFFMSQISTTWKVWFFGALTLVLLLTSAYVFYSYLSVDPIDFG